ncbi:MAG: methyltransferase [Candidatus Woesearchaeota archaeon]
MGYEPQEDSFLLQKYVKKFAKGVVLDMGTGSGIQANAAASRAKKVIAVDKDKEVIKQLNKSNTNKKITYHESDLFSCFKKVHCGRFDTIIFNPPYLPREGSEDLALDGGRKG